MRTKGAKNKFNSKQLYCIRDSIPELEKRLKVIPNSWKTGGGLNKLARKFGITPDYENDFDGTGHREMFSGKKIYQFLDLMEQNYSFRKRTKSKQNTAKKPDILDAGLDFLKGGNSPLPKSGAEREDFVSQIVRDVNQLIDEAEVGEEIVLKKGEPEYVELTADSTGNKVAIRKTAVQTVEPRFVTIPGKFEEYAMKGSHINCNGFGLNVREDYFTVRTMVFGG